MTSLLKAVNKCKMCTVLDLLIWNQRLQEMSPTYFDRYVAKSLIRSIKISKKFLMFRNIETQIRVLAENLRGSLPVMFLI